MPELLGQHESIAQDLHSRIIELSNGTYSGPHVVVLRGASGVGKTAIIQRLYELLRLDNFNNPWHGYGQYWPELNSVDNSSNPLRDRALLSPELDSFVWAQDTLPTFGWWSFNCEELRNSQKIDVVAMGKEQMATHLAPLSLAWWEASGTLAQIGSVLSEVTTRVRKDLQSDVADSLLESSLEALSIGIPLPATLTSWVTDILRWVGKKRKDSINLHQDVYMGKQHVKAKKDAGKELAEAIKSLTAKRLPGIVVVEDMHLMGPELRSLLNALSERDNQRPVMVIGTAWPEGMTQDDFMLWQAEMKAKSDDQMRLIDVDVPSLQEESLVELLLRYAPETSEDVATKVVEKLNTPLFLLLWITEPNVALEIRLAGNKILLSDNFKLPDSVEQVVENRWNALPDDVRNALTTAVAGNPSNPDMDKLNRFVPAVISEVFKEIYQVLEETTKEAIQKARDPIGWCRGSIQVTNFSDPLLARHVRKSVQGLSTLKTHMRRITQQACTNWLDKHREHLDLPNTTQVEAVVDWYLKFADDESSLTFAAAQIHVARRNMEAYEFSKAIEHYNAALNVIAEVAGDRDRTMLLRQIASCYYAMSEYSDAEAIIMELLPIQIRLDGHSHPDTLAVKLLHARLLMRSGEPLRAMPVLLHITEMLQQHFFGKSIPENVIQEIYIPLVTLKGDLSFESHANDDAIEFYDHGSEVSAKIYGERSLKTLILQLKRLRAVHAQTPESEVAFDQGTELLTKIREVSGGQSAVALEAESNLIFWGYKAQQIENVEEAFRDLDLRIPKLRDYASLRADTYLWAGDIALEERRFADAQHWFSACLSVVNEHHGAYDPLSLRAAHQLGVTLLKLEQYDSAREVVETLTENARIVVGPTGSSAVRAEVLLSLIYQILRRDDEAIKRLTKLRAEFVSDSNADIELVELVDARLRKLNLGVKFTDFYPLVQMKNGRFGRLRGTDVDDDPLWFIEGDREFPEITNQLIVIGNTENFLERAPEHWAYYLSVLSRAYLNLGSCYWRSGKIDEADQAFGAADKCVNLYFSRASKTGDIPPDPEMAEMASRGVALSINMVGMLVALNLTSDMREVFDKNRERAFGLLSQLNNETQENLRNVNLELLEQVLVELIPE